MQSIAWLCGFALLLCGCAASPPVAPPRPVVTDIAVVERGWHTEVCVRAEDADTWIIALASGFDGARFLCFGFGERQYLVRGDHGVLSMLSAMLPSQAAVLMTALRDTPAAAFDPGNVVLIGITRSGLSGLRLFLRRTTQVEGASRPLRLGEADPGSVFFAATGIYDGLYTCNTWTADALRSAGLPVSNAVLFAGGVMRQARRLAAAGSRQP